MKDAGLLPGRFLGLEARHAGGSGRDHNAAAVELASATRVVAHEKAGRSKENMPAVAKG